MNNTIYNVQLLLAALGYDPGTPDGIDGPRTQAALAQALSDHGAQPSETSSFWDEIRYFQREEFRCPCPRCGGFPAEPREKLVRMAEAVRSHFGAPATVSSGVRCSAHNAEVGGVSNSRHLTGSAVDLSIKGHTAQEIVQYVRTLPECAYTYAIDGSYVHMDVI